MFESIAIIIPLCFAVFTHAAASNYPLPIPCTGEACTTFQGAFQDASVIRRPTDGTYFRYSRGSSPGHGLTVSTAPALKGPWTYRSIEVLNSTTHLSDPSITNRTNTHLWAPEVHLIHDIYYLYYCIFDNSTGHGQSMDIAVATSKTLEPGSWIDHGSIGIPEDHKHYASIGVNLIANTSHTSGESPSHHLSFGSANGGIFGIRMADPPLRVVQNATAELLINGRPTNTANKVEASFQLRHQDYVYLFYSRGSCCPGSKLAADLVYKVEVCRAREPTGPFFDRNNKSCTATEEKAVNDFGTVILESHSDDQVYAPGSIGVMNDTTEGLVMYYQYFNKTAGNLGNRKFGFNYLEFDEGKWPILVEERKRVKVGRGAMILSGLSPE